MSDITEPRCLEATISRGGGGKVAIVDFGRHSSDYSIFFSRKYEIPEGWDDEVVAAFQVAKHDELVELIDAIDQDEMDKRLDHANWVQEGEGA